ncbi:MAG: MBL fold metallo-hydrolase [Candidatus Methanomethylicia archaeon]|nr:MBL fold metallo-hydrolase [Candidatus Methanomethylicia archaeon]MDW7988520.1 MBL fold metallo-hydrolase [Nitrososphaerota archaeon]
MEMDAFLQVKSSENVKVYATISYGLSSNIYLIEGVNEIGMIDVGYGPPHSNIFEVLNVFKINVKEITKILITHRHKDHTRELKKILNENDNAKIYIHRNDRDIVIDSLGIDKNRVSTLYGNEEIKINDAKIKVIYTPGHTSGSLCFKYEDTLFTGDLVFSDGLYGRTDLPSGNHRELVESLKKVLKLDIEYMLPGHGGIVLKDAKLHIKLALKSALK